LIKHSKTRHPTRSAEHTFKHVSVYLEDKPTTSPNASSSSGHKTQSTQNTKTTIPTVTSRNRRGAPPTYPFHSICNFQRTIRYLKRRPKTWRHSTSGGGFYSCERAVSTTIDQPHEDSAGTGCKAALRLITPP
jgi:hypothetical protein